MQRWSFDDHAIGLNDGTKLTTREIQRPPGLGMHAWYTHAAAVVAVLNRVAAP